MVKVEPHDLLQISSVSDLAGTLPAWTETMFPKSLTVVVRRSPVVDGQIPVGLRGMKREHRFATYLDPNAIQKIITPYELVQDKAWQNITGSRKQLPAIKVLPQIAQILTGYNWGISGSVGFELATKTIAAKMTSDLDLVWKPSTVIDKKSARELLKQMNSFGVHADFQVIQNNNGFSLEEYANSSSTIMMKTLGDPILVTDPWSER